MGGMDIEHRHDPRLRRNIKLGVLPRTDQHQAIFIIGDSTLSQDDRSGKCRF
jgi:hypothetical protein